MSSESIYKRLQYSVIIDGKIFFDQPVKSYIRTYDKIQKLITGQGDDYTTGCLLDYPYFKGVLLTPQTINPPTTDS